MNFQDFLATVPKIKSIALPAKEAHYKMAPLDRIRFLENLNLETLNPKKAAVLVLLYPKKGETHLVLIQRNSYEGVHSAQIAFPGGKYENEDQNFETTALRETQEEIGVLFEKIEIIMSMTSLYIAPSNFEVYPFLGIANEELVFVPDPKEVSEIIELPLTTFLSEEMVIETEIKTSYAKSIRIPAYKINGHIVWGATAMMMSELKELLKKVI